MKKVFAVLALLLWGIFMVSYSWGGEIRKWTSGKYTVEGQYIKLTDNGRTVWIQQTNGKVVRIPLAKLSQEDVSYVEEKEIERQMEQEENPFEEVINPFVPAGKRIVLTSDGIDYAFRWCPPGVFMMGSSNGNDDEKPVHKVTLSKGFWLLETEVTQAMWESVMGSNPSKFKGKNNPVECVSWDLCREFCKQLSQKLGKQVKLPTEAQWEYACRAGSTGSYAGDIYEMAWYWGSSGSTPHAVGQKKPNAWGLYDMHGNVWEWCSDYYDEDFYARSPTSDPENTATSSYRVHRGGCWDYYAEYCRSASRNGVAPVNRSHSLGVRVLLVPSPAE